MDQAEHDETLQLTLEVWHPGCWILDVTGQIDVGMLGYVSYTREDGRATTNFRMYGDEQQHIEDALAITRAHPSVYSVSEMAHGYRRGDEPAPGNATRELLVEHDGTTQIGEAFTSRGFALAVAADAYGESERWSVLTNGSRDAMLSALDDIREAEHAEITVESIEPANHANRAESFPLDRLSHRQREVFQLARRSGYYRHPKATSARELADELGVSTSTFHEHLHKAEQKLLDLPEPLGDGDRDTQAYRSRNWR